MQCLRTLIRDSSLQLLLLSVVHTTDFPFRSHVGSMVSCNKSTLFWCIRFSLISSPNVGPHKCIKNLHQMLIFPLANYRWCVFTCKTHQCSMALSIALRIDVSFTHWTKCRHICRYVKLEYSLTMTVNRCKYDIMVLFPLLRPATTALCDRLFWDHTFPNWTRECLFLLPQAHHRILRKWHQWKNYRLWPCCWHNAKYWPHR